MDPNRFDALTKLLGSAASRRFTIQRVLGPALLGVLGVIPAVGDARRPEKAAKNRNRQALRGGHARKRAERDRQEPSATSKPRRQLKATTRAAAASIEIDYFALGDSIAAGHGLGDTGNGRGQWCAPDGSDCCRRSPNAYPFKLKDRLTANGYTVNFPAANHLACSGAKLGDLAGQVMEMRDRLEASNPPQRPTLVTVSIGGNDSGLTDLFTQIDVLYLKTPAQFEEFLGSLSEHKLGLQVVLTAMLELPGVVIVLNELYNPMNRKSVYFKGVFDDGQRCGAVVSCWNRVDLIVQTMNEHWQDVVDELARNPRYAGRIAMTSGLAAEFSQHWGAAGVRRQKCNKNDKKCQKEAAKQPEYQEECGYQEPPAGKGSTYILSRTGLDVPPNRTNSYPYRDASLLQALIQYALALGPDQRRFWKGDCIHPNDAGHAAIARKVAEAVLRLKIACPNGGFLCDGVCCAKSEACVVRTYNATRLIRLCVDAVAGCSAPHNACGGATIPCPNAPSGPNGGNFCILTNDEQPYCASSISCWDPEICQTDADCNPYGGNASRCVSSCSASDYCSEHGLNVCVSLYRG